LPRLNATGKTGTHEGGRFTNRPYATFTHDRYHTLIPSHT